MLNSIHIYKHADKLLTFGYSATNKLEYIVQESILNFVEGIYVAKISSTKQTSKLSFINYHADSLGILNLSDKDKLQDGSSVLCQMNWRGDDEKLAKFTQQIKFIGRYVILLGKSNHGKNEHVFSKKMQNQHVFTQFSEKFSGYKLIFRSSCDCVPSELYKLIVIEIELLITRYNQCLLAVNSGKYGVVLCGVHDYLRFVRNMQFDSSIKIITNCTDVFNKLQQYTELWQIQHFDLDIDLTPSATEIDAIYTISNNNSILNKHGSNLICHKLSGINLIDINSDKSQQNSYTVNYLLCDEIISVIKIRDLSGIILIDFIKNMTQKQQQQITDKLNKLLLEDWRKSKILGFTNAGLFEIIRSK